MKAMDQYDFDMTWCNYSGSLWKDPESMWASKEADRPAGQNYTGFKHPRVDELIDRQRGEFDVRKRAALMREFDGILTEQVPYVLLWYLNYTRIIYWNKYGTPDHVLGSISDERAALQYWWYDEDDAADLREARASGLALPKRPFAVRFDDVFRQTGSP
jgi:microcin C transport system substrate-binding protein